MSPAQWLSSGHGDDAGFEELQTDVMRFMAILAFCLMAVFALVQSMPLTAQLPPITAPAVATPQPTVAPIAVQAVTGKTPRAEVVLAVPQALPEPVSDVPAAVAKEAPAPLPLQEQKKEAPPDVPASPPTATPVEKPQGVYAAFHLRFCTYTARFPWQSRLVRF